MFEPFALERYFAEHEFSAPFLLCASDCEAHSIDELLEMEPDARTAFGKTWLGYTEAAGSPELRDLIAAQYEGISREDVLVFSGAQEAIFCFMQRALAPGDHAVVQFPAYQSLYAVARTNGIDLTMWRTREENCWELQLGFLSQAVRAQTKAIVMNVPHNPTGYLMNGEKQAEIVRIARACGAHLFSDEVYRDSEYDPATRLPAICEIYEKGVSLGVMSKSLGLAGLRIGWIATHDRDLLTRLAEMKDYLTICGSAPSEFLACVALRNREAILKRNGELTAANLALLDAFIARHRDQVSWVRPQAAPIGFLRIHDPRGASPFTDDLLEKMGVLLLPSAVYQMEDTHVRIGFGRANFSEGLTRLDGYLELL